MESLPSMCNFETLSLIPVLNWVTIAVMKHHAQKQVGKERVDLAYASTDIVHQ